LRGTGAGTVTATGFNTSFSIIRTWRESSNRVAMAIPATTTCTKAINPKTQQATGKTGNFPEGERVDASGSMGVR
jgi:hypothetical protein